MIRRPPRSTRDPASAASDVYKRQPWQPPDPDDPCRYEKIQATIDRFGGRRAIILQMRDVWSGPRAYIGSVSYTHLRAPETVLDLVCRILLEQKKPDTCGALYYLIALKAPGQQP